MPEWVQLAVNLLLGGSLATILIQSLLSRKAENRCRRAELLKESIQQLYAPLYFIAAQNMGYASVVKQLEAAGDHRYVRSIRGGHTQSSLELMDREIEKVDSVRNAYVEETHCNAASIVSLINAQSSHIDPADIEEFTRYVVEYMRFSKEFDQNDGWQLPRAIAETVGYPVPQVVSFHDYIESRFQAKMKELGKLTR